MSDEFTDALSAKADVVIEMGPPGALSVPQIEETRQKFDERQRREDKQRGDDDKAAGELWAMIHKMDAMLQDADVVPFGSRRWVQLSEIRDSLRDFANAVEGGWGRKEARNG